MKPKHHKTKIVCTIGPSCQSENVLGRMMRAGMSIARLNFAHGNLAQHGRDIQRIREVARRLGHACDILIDLPGPKIRLGKLKKEPLHLKKGHLVRLTTQETPGTAQRLYVNYPKLPQSVRKGGLIYLNDGFLQLEVLKIKKTEVYCKVLIGGPLLSFKGLNLPKAKLFVEPVTENDLRYLDFGLAHGVDLFGVSFIEKAGDILKVKAHARENGRKIRTVAKIERAEALQNLGGILKVTDMVMVARGDLGVQIPIEDVPLVQKGIIHAGLKRGVPVITATQMLESMVHNVRPTRAEVTDVANAILDGTSGVMLSEETAIGEYPVETVEMMARIARKTESAWKGHPLKKL